MNIKWINTAFEYPPIGTQVFVRREGVAEVYIANYSDGDWWINHRISDSAPDETYMSVSFTEWCAIPEELKGMS